MDQISDVLIVGSGIMGAAVARQLQNIRPSTTMVMVDGGPALGGPTGQHLHDTEDDTVRATYAQRVASGIQSLYRGTAPTDDIGATTRGVAPGMYSASSFGHDTDQMPAASFAWNVGGMGVHWTAATPTPWGVEVFDHSGRFTADLATASKLLRVHADPFGPSTPGRPMLTALVAEFGPESAPGRAPQPMPMAAQPTGGRVVRTGPAGIFPRLRTGPEAGFDLRSGLATSLIHDGRTVAGAALTDLGTGDRSEVRARTTVVCADPLRTPQLLFASGIRPPALGRWFAEHAFLTGRVIADVAGLGVGLHDLPEPLPDEWLIGSYWLPHSGERQPFHGQIMDSVPRDEDGRALAYQVGLSWYVPTSLRADNRLEFSDTESDVTGMPRMTIHFHYDSIDLGNIEAARASQARAGRRLGDFDPATDSALLPAGSSLHFTGSARSGSVDDGTCVCDPDGRVWGFDNLHLAGGAVVSTPAVGNSTLLATVTAVRAADAVAAHLDR